MNFFIIRDSPTGNGGNNPQMRKNVVSGFVAVLKERRIYPFLVGYILLSFSWVFITWMPQFLVDDKHYSYIDAGIISSVGTIAGIPGCIAIGAISDKLKKRKLPLVIFAGLYVILLAAFLYLPTGIHVSIYAIISASISFCMSIWVLFFSMIPEILPREKASIGLGVINGFGTIGFSLVTPIYGMLIDSTGGFRFSNLLILGIGLLMTMILGLFTKETYETKNQA
jgi:sugar phosphate permease